MTKLIAEGFAAGDFRPCDPQQTLTSILGVIIFYFISVPAQQLMAAGDPFAPERIAARRAAVLDFVSAAVLRPGNRLQVTGDSRGKRRKQDFSLREAEAGKAGRK